MNAWLLENICAKDRSERRLLEEKVEWLLEKTVTDRVILL